MGREAGLATQQQKQEQQQQQQESSSAGESDVESTHAPFVSGVLHVSPAAAARLADEAAVVGIFRNTPETPVTPLPFGINAGEAVEPRSAIQTIVDEYLEQSIACVHTPLVDDGDIKSRFLSTHIPSRPMPLNQYLDRIAPSFVKDSTRVTCSRQIGHMTGSLPRYIPPLAELVTTMNQNVVKSETAKTLTLLEKEVIACIHRLTFRRDDRFYEVALQDTETAMGVFTSGGTIANITGLWVARNGSLGPDLERGFEGCEQCGVISAALHYGYKGAVIIGTRLMHYSLKKAADVLGIGVHGLIAVDYDDQFRVIVPEVEAKLRECAERRICVLALVGLAGGTETGSCDDLQALAELARKYGVHFHVDAAWGGPCLFSSALAPTLAGIAQADTVTIDGHKQLFMPMGCGMLLLKDPEKCKLVSKTANYIIRSGSNDLGRFTLEGSRPGNVVYMHANFHCIGARGYEVLMDRSVRVCRYMASMLRASGKFEVLLDPQMNILLYRYVPESLRARVLGSDSHDGARALTDADYHVLDEANTNLQEKQKAEGRTFVSRTTIFHVRHQRHIVALRVVIGNPVTEEGDIDAVIADQLLIAEGGPAAKEQSQTTISDDHQCEFWQRYWARMPESARVFFMNDLARFQSTLINPSMPPLIE